MQLFGVNFSKQNLNSVYAIGISTLFFLMIGLLAGCDNSSQEKPAVRSSISVVDKLGAISPGNYARAYRTRRFSFPTDHISHPEYKHEWWYFSGNLSTDSGRRFGYQLTLFRIGLNDAESGSLSGFASKSFTNKVGNKSRWRAKNFYMAHFAVTDVSANKFFSHERFQRSALGLAGALQKGINTDDSTQGIRIWVDDWVVESVTDGVFPIRLSAEQGEISIKLYLDNVKSIVLNGDEGLSQKGRKAGNASYYYSIPRMETSGTIVVEGETFRVAGTSWLDREWSTTVLEPGQVGWDWFGLQLQDGREIMFYQIRQSDGSMDDFSAGTFVKKDGTYVLILAREVEIKVEEYWSSPKTGIRYPAAWTIRLLRHNIELSIAPLVAHQEMDLTVKYWEGAVVVKGRNLDGNRSSIRGYGYVELAGYDK